MGMDAALEIYRMFKGQKSAFLGLDNLSLLEPFVRISLARSTEVNTQISCFFKVAQKYTKIQILFKILSKNKLFRD